MSAVTEPRWLDDDELSAWRNYSLMQLQLFALLGRELAADGLSYPDYLVLAHLDQSDGCQLRLNQLGQDLGWEKSRVSHHVRRMEQRGLVRKVKCPTDQRGWFVAITDTGRAANRAAAPGHVATVRRHVVDLLSADQLRTLDEIAQIVLANLPQD
jgi:DNA-binding MarR family transcriptional regulator